jgi:purine-nucleoside phosphorylase
MLGQIKDAAAFIERRGIKKPEIGIILGTGLGNLFVKEIRNQIILPYNSIPHFPVATVEFHKGQLIYGELRGKRVLAMRGRFHLYEGHTAKQITLPVRVMKLLGVETLLISNAAGNLNLKWKKGELMVIDDHINLQPDNPLRGENFDMFGPRFPDMSQPYSQKLNSALMRIAKKKSIKLNKGVYAAVMGPNLETRAEYRYIRTLGADVVGMSTVPEVLVANHMGLACCAVSVLTDNCDPDNLEPVNIDDIIKTAQKAEKKLTELYLSLIESL